jgi:hypothetical protein
MTRNRDVSNQMSGDCIDSLDALVLGTIDHLIAERFVGDMPLQTKHL